MANGDHGCDGYTGKITPSDLAERQKSRWMMASTGLNALLSVAKIGWGIYSGSTVVIADAVHSISDVLGALLILAAIRFFRHRSLRFPYGLHKVEDMAALGGAMLVVVAAYEIASAACRECPVRGRHHRYRCGKLRACP